MQVKVTKKVIILKTELIGTNNVNTVECSFDLGEEFNGLIPIAVFTVNDTSYKVNIIENKSIVPWEVLKEENIVELGVYGFQLNGDELIKRYSPVSTFFEVKKGSYKEGTEGQDATPNSFEYYLEACNSAKEEAELYKESAKLSEENSKISENNAKLSEENCRTSEENAKQSETNAQISENNAENSKQSAELSSDKAQQALADLLRMLGTDIATLENGKIPASQIPAIATTEIYYASNLEEMNNLVAQNGDICIRTDEKKSYIYKDTGWVFLVSPSDFATNAEHANTADFASNAGMINDKRIISMTQSQYDLAVKEENTYYFVTAD